MDSKTKFLADKATHYADDICDHNAGANWYEVRDTKFAALIRADEREACAKVCDEWGEAVSVHLAATIRARSDELQNNNLIAVASDLLESLQAIVDDFEFVKNNPGFGDRSAAYAETARDAIAKAKNVVF